MYVRDIVSTCCPNLRTTLYNTLSKSKMHLFFLMQLTARASRNDINYINDYEFVHSQIQTSYYTCKYLNYIKRKLSKAQYRSLIGKIYFDLLIYKRARWKADESLLRHSTAREHP